VFKFNTRPSHAIIQWLTAPCELECCYSGGTNFCGKIQLILYTNFTQLHQYFCTISMLDCYAFLWKTIFHTLSVFMHFWMNAFLSCSTVKICATLKCLISLSFCAVCIRAHCTCFTFFPTDTWNWMLILCCKFQLFIF
jgi:hypothetical protein